MTDSRTAEQTAQRKAMLESCMCLQFRMASRLLTQYYDEELRSTEVRVTQMPILVALAMDGPTSVNQFAKRLMMDRSTLGQNAKPLEAKGLIAITAGADRRTREIKLTDAGFEVVDRMMPLWEKAQARVVTGLGKRQSTKLLWDLAAVKAVVSRL